MKKKILIAGSMVACSTVSIVLAYLVHWVVGILVLLLGIAAIVWKRLNRITKKVIDADRPTSYFKDLSGRNMDAIIVGSSKAWKYVKIPKKKKIYSALSYGTTSNMEFNILKTYFSHVKKHGLVYFVYDNTDGIREKRITPIDYKMVHQHIFLQLGIKLEEKKAKRPYSYFKKLMTKYLFSYVMKKIGLYRSRTWKCNKRIGEVTYTDIEKKYQLLEEVVLFCKERDLFPKILLLDSTAQSNSTNRKICELLRSKYTDDICICVQTANELNRILAE